MPADIQRIDQDQLSCWRIRRAGHELLVAEQGAQVLGYRLDDAPPIVWLSDQAAYRKGQPVRGGIPLCWPWFGDLRRNPSAVRAMHPDDSAAPAHGLVRGLDWRLERLDSTDEAVHLEFSCNLGEAGLPDWPHPLDLSLRIRLDERLHLDLTSHNRGATPVALSQALHSYFAVSDIRQVRVEGLAGHRYLDTLENWEQRRQQGDLRIEGETDRLYLELTDSLSLVDPVWNRRIALQSRGSTSAVLWNPWIDKARRLSQFADDAWQRMLCIETANLMDDVVHLDAGTSHCLGVSIGVQAL